MDYNGYLFVYFTGESDEGEQVYFAVSRDGLHWTDLNSGNPVLYSEIGEKGVRDPFIIRSNDGTRFYIIATDLRIANGKGWHAAQYEGSRSIIVWESIDLIHWSKERHIEVDIDGAGCVWAPEAIYNKETDDYLIFWASMVKEIEDSEAKQRIYCAKTKDFYNFSKTEKYIERKNHVIDTTIVRNNGIYYRFSKDETTKNIKVDKSDDLSKGVFTNVNIPILEKLMGVEGPAVFKFNDSDRWCLLVDRFAEGKGYLPLVTNDLETCQFRILDSSEYDMGENKKRHGSVLNITEDEIKRLCEMWG